MNPADDPLLQAHQHAVKHAMAVAHAQLAVEVWGWAIKHAMGIPAPALP